MQKTAIEWVRNPDGTQGFSWNPLKGRCPVRCSLPDGRVYCYGHKHYDLRPWLEEGIGDNGALAEWELRAPMKRKKPAGIFVCSTFELFFHKYSFFRSEIFRTIGACPQHRFYILTKFPQNIDGPLPYNVWLGISITGNTTEDFDRAVSFGLKKRRAKIQFVSYEPLLGRPIQNIPNADWIIIGKLTKHGKEFDPKREVIRELYLNAKANNRKVFMKNNLKSIWGRPGLIQEMPGDK